MNDINFWNDKEKADEVIKEASNIKSTIEKITIIKNNLDTNIETLEILKDEEDPEILELLNKDLDKLTTYDINKIAIGEPESVPAGKYAKEVLDNTNLYDKVKDNDILSIDDEKFADYKIIE